MSKKKVLFLGLRPPENAEWLHYPIIKVVARDPKSTEISTSLKNFHQYTHCIFTSQTAVEILHNFLPNREQKKNIVVGKKTAACLESYGQKVFAIAREETAEGVVDLLKSIYDKNNFFFWPHAAGARDLITNYFEKHNVNYCACPFYDTYPNEISPLPDISKFDEIVFTSPSCVDAFIKIFKLLPQDKTLTAIGPITEQRMKDEF